MAKLRVGVIFGGRSGEHEVSLMSAKSVISALNPQKYEVVPIGITKKGKWQLSTGAIEIAQSGLAEAFELVPDPTINQGFDVIFPVLHGPYGEDGTIQGFLELANIPYVGAGVASSAVSMDKAFMRVLFANAGLPLAKWVTVLGYEWEQDRSKITALIEQNLGFPCFVKPANLGSSVGVSKARNAVELAMAIESAAEYDRKIIVEEAILNSRELECSVLGNKQPLVSVPGEIIPGSEFYDYEAKYVNDSSELIIPAELSPKQRQELTELAVRAYKAVDCAGMARVDFFLTSEEKILVNEINTIPGFTKISMYPKLWEASGISYSELVDRLISLALERHAERNRLRTDL